MTEREKSEKERRNERLQAALRENLRRRKAQARERVEKAEKPHDSAGIVTEEKETGNFVGRGTTWIAFASSAASR